VIGNSAIFTACVVWGAISLILLSACDVQGMRDYLAQQPPEQIILQDGVDAFAGYSLVEIPDTLSDTYPNQGKAIVAFLTAFDLRALANTEGVSAWAKIRTSTADETTWEYELAYLPDDAVYATGYKIYLEDVDGGISIARIGHRVKCRRGPEPKRPESKQWTVAPCP